MTLHKTGDIVTFMDCPDRKQWVGIFGTERFYCHHPHKNILVDECDECRNDWDYCPRGFR